MIDEGTHDGQCHCGSVSVSFRTSGSEPLDARACQCGFCRRHGAKTVTDTDGFVEITSNGTLVRYRFGLMTADYLLCARCGVYVASAIEADHITRVTLNTSGLGMKPWCDSIAQPVDYTGETIHERLDRRRANWTPARVVERAFA